MQADHVSQCLFGFGFDVDSWAPPLPPEDSFWQRLLDFFSPASSSNPTLTVAMDVAVALLVLILVAWVLRTIWRALFRRKRGPGAWDRELDIDLDDCPLPTRPPGDRQLTVYHYPARLRLVVVAPVGRDADVDATAVEKLLDRVVPGLGAAAQADRPRVRVWPSQMSHQGFAASFHRHTPKAAERGEPSRWVLLAGRAQLGRQQLMVGLGLWADEPLTIDRVTLEPHQWLDVLRLVPV